MPVTCCRILYTAFSLIPVVNGFFSRFGGDELKFYAGIGGGKKVATDSLWSIRGWNLQWHVAAIAWQKCRCSGPTPYNLNGLFALAQFQQSACHPFIRVVVELMM